nr:hypothetical protein L204_04449 [Cryptococcus depauperatus CBS 7855]
MPEAIRVRQYTVYCLDTRRIGVFRHAQSWTLRVLGQEGGQIVDMIWDVDRKSGSTWCRTAVYMRTAKPTAAAFDVEPPGLPSVLSLYTDSTCHTSISDRLSSQISSTD